MCLGSPLTIPHVFSPLVYSHLSCSVIVLRNGGHQVRRTFPKTTQLVRHPQKALKMIRNIFFGFPFPGCSCLKRKTSFFRKKQINMKLSLSTVNYFLYISSTIVFLCQLKTALSVDVFCIRTSVPWYQVSPHYVLGRKVNLKH